MAVEILRGPDHMAMETRRVRSSLGIGLSYSFSLSESWAGLWPPSCPGPDKVWIRRGISSIKGRPKRTSLVCLRMLPRTCNASRVTNAPQVRNCRWEGTVLPSSSESIVGGAATDLSQATSPVGSPCRTIPRPRQKCDMNSFKLIPFIFCLLTTAAFSREEPQLARVTVYWASGGSGSDRNTRHHRCATGARLRDGHCAVDPRHIPYGSRVLLPNGEALAAVDTGSAVRNRKAARLAGRTAFEKRALVIDRFFETKRQALAWANSHPAFMPIKVLRPNTHAAVAFQSGPAELPASLYPPAQVRVNSRPQIATATGNTNQVAASNRPKSRVPLNRMGR